MRIWVTEIGEPLPLEPRARLLRYGIMTRHWARQGHDVTWWTSNFSHATRSFVTRGDAVEVVDGVRLRILGGVGYRRSVSVRRVLHQAHFAFRFARLARREAPPDVLLTPIPTLETARAAVRFGLEKEVPVLVDVRDEWPDEFVDLAPPRLRPLTRALFAKQFADVRFICSRASGIIGTGEKFLTYGLRHARRRQGDHDAVIPFPYEPAAFDPGTIDSAIQWWAEQGVTADRFVCCFFGTMGRFFRLETVIDAARRLADLPDVLFVLCGDGDSFSDIRRYAEGAGNVRLPGWVDGGRIAALMRLSRVGLAPYRVGARMAMPNKPIEYFAGGLPILSSLRGELEQLLAERRCGITYDAEDPRVLADAIRRLHARAEDWRELRDNAVSVFEGTYRAEPLSSRMLEHLMRVREAYRR